MNVPIHRNEIIAAAVQEWMPEEGPNKAQRRALREQAHATASQQAALQAKTRAASEQAMRVALSGEVNWGMGGEDADVSGIDNDAPVDWRRLFDSGKLTEKQQKVAERIRTKEFKIKVRAH